MIDGKNGRVPLTIHNVGVRVIACSGVRLFRPKDLFPIPAPISKARGRLAVVPEVFPKLISEEYNPKLIRRISIEL